MSSQANVTFKTISLFGTHDGERNTLAHEQHALDYATISLHGALLAVADAS
ncbi:hypothetical protein [Bradyrhizobium canariense]|uniref:hypothetical protein n=1 Tax=Bradyrhizobium canariense TaxID=255045 RepID=UPI001B8A8962|nr:hypothetical protein [Bradyrhizobium canariense]MBR0954771.1 hypothetical protein [Bradyrhizobium canariense]